jgi:2,3-bisphosphoglycerate-independent phosphoglycerate mutase
MDRDKRWDRVTVAIKGLIAGEGEATEDPVAKIKERYEQGENDEFLKPIIVNGDEARIKGMFPSIPRLANSA